MSVVIPTRGRADSLRRAVASVEGQDYPGLIECVVVFDQTEEVDIGRPPGPERSLRTLASRRTPGPAGARNAGAEVTTGDLLAFCDDDDEWLPTKIRRQVDAFARSDGVSAVTCGIIVSYKGRTVPRMSDRDRITLSDLIRSRDAAIHTSSLLLRRADFTGLIGGFDESMPGGYGEDYEWLLRAASLGPLLNVRESLVSVRWHDASWFDGKWDLIIEAIDRLLELHPEIRHDRKGLGRLFGRLAFAHAAAGRKREASRWAWQAVLANPSEKRAYLAVAVAAGLSARTALELAHMTGRGI